MLPCMLLESRLWLRTAHSSGLVVLALNRIESPVLLSPVVLSSSAPGDPHGVLRPLPLPSAHPDVQPAQLPASPSPCGRLLPALPGSSQGAGPLPGRQPQGARRSGLGKVSGHPGDPLPCCESTSFVAWGLQARHSPLNCSSEAAWAMSGGERPTSLAPRWTGGWWGS